jgi:hypothetical protein
MSTGHRAANVREKTTAELDKVLGEGDTPQLMAQAFTVDYTHDIAYAGGISVDRKIVYIDAWVYEQIMSGKVRVRGLSPRQVIDRIVDHEHSEKAVDDGDNDVDVYEPAHAYALRKEHNGVDAITGGGKAAEDRYEEDLRPLLAACQARFIKLGRRANPPKNLWAGPTVDHATADDKKILAIMRAKGVEDAHKISKFEVHYSVGGEECRHCAMFGAGSGPLRKCDLVSGLVRDDHWCDRWEKK